MTTIQNTVPGGKFMGSQSLEAQPSRRGLRMLRMMIGHGEPWEQHHIETLGVEALRVASRSPVDEQFHLLRTRLIDRGKHEAADITPEL